MKNFRKIGKRKSIRAASRLKGGAVRFFAGALSAHSYNDAQMYAIAVNAEILEF